jgi:hypothetical protein
MRETLGQDQVNIRYEVNLTVRQHSCVASQFIRGIYIYIKCKPFDSDHDYDSDPSGEVETL